MPYVKQYERNQVESELCSLCKAIQPLNSGLVNYVITTIVASSMKPSIGWSYSTLSKALAVFRDAEAEMRRRLLDTYEEEKIEENGDISAYESSS